jgi:hypothetical protein
VLGEGIRQVLAVLDMWHSVLLDKSGVPGAVFECCASTCRVGHTGVAEGLDRDTTIQFPASTLLSSYGQDAASAVPGLRELLKSQNQITRFLAASCLRELGVDSDLNRKP